MVDIYLSIQRHNLSTNYANGRAVQDSDSSFSLPVDHVSFGTKEQRTTRYWKFSGRSCKRYRKRKEDKSVAA
ncbi:unnamed protein product [Urochloa humidicola]